MYHESKVTAGRILCLILCINNSFSCIKSTFSYSVVLSPIQKYVMGIFVLVTTLYCATNSAHNTTNCASLYSGAPL